MTALSLLQGKAIDLENEMRGLLRNFGLKVGRTEGGTFEKRVLELVDRDAELAEFMEPLLAGRRKLREDPLLPTVPICGAINNLPAATAWGLL
ncbi:hypothetical protein V7S54_30430 [Ensifer sp. CCNWLY38]